MREIKFQFWNKTLQKMSKVYSIGVVYEYLCEEWDIFSWEEVETRQFTGLHDKNGTEIYDCDLLRVSRNVQVGTRIATIRRQLETFSVHEMQEGIALVEWDGYTYVGKTNLYDDYLSYFYVSSRKDKPIKIHQQIILPSTTFGSSEVIDNIYESPELVEATCQ